MFLYLKKVLLLIQIYPMRLICFLLCFFLLLSCFAQTRQKLKETSFDPTSFEKFIIEIKHNKKDKPVEVNYNAVHFIDARADSSKLGFAMAGVTNMIFYFLAFPKPVATYLDEKAIPYLSKTAARKKEITFVINHLWLCERAVKATPGKSLLAGPIVSRTFCYVNVDCYSFVDNQYVLFGKIDTVISTNKWIIDDADNLLKQSLTGILLRADSLLVSPTIHSTPITGNLLTKTTMDKFDLPILKESQITKGVFLTYDEFLNNRPSLTDFTIVREKNGEYIRSNEIAGTRLDSAWGYYDGTDLNMHIQNRFYRMVRIQNTFEMAGPKPLVYFDELGRDLLYSSIYAVIFRQPIGPSLAMSFIPSGKDPTLKELIPYQLNIENGGIY
jgi:hypothetical protein